MSNQNEINVYEFVQIPSEPAFECNRIGQVRKIGSNNVKKLTMANDGYLRTRCNGHLCYVHRLIAETFIPNPDNLPEVDHINNNKTDNNYLNLIHYINILHLLELYYWMHKHHHLEHLHGVDYQQ